MSTATSLLFTSSPGIQHSLTYLFSVVLKMRCESVSLQAGISEITQSARDTDLAILDGTGGDCAVSDVLRTLMSLAKQPKVIVLQPLQSTLGAWALSVGADDVIVWPGNMHELALRSYLRLGLSLDEPQLRGGGHNWEIGARIAEDANLSFVEAQIVKILFDNFGEIVSRDDLSYALDDRPWRYGDRKFDVHIAKIRKKLSESSVGNYSVETVRAEGYQLSLRGDEMSEQRCDNAS